MIKNYLKITARSLLRNKVFSVLNIMGIGLSIAICLVIIIYIRDWRSADRFHTRKDRIFRVYITDTNTSWDMDGWATTPAYLAPHLRLNYPDIEQAVRLRWMTLSVLHQGTALNISGFYAEPSFFDIFDFPLKAGDPREALEDPFSIVLSDEYSRIFFGDEDPMGQVLRIENAGDFIVTGVLGAVDEKTHLNFKSLVSFSTIESLIGRGLMNDELNDWKYKSSYYTYVLTKESGVGSGFERQLPELEKAVIPEEEAERFGFGIENICDINLGKNMSYQTPGTKSKADVIFVPFLAVAIVFLVCFNYVILSIARSLKRSKEIGLRKVMGSDRTQVFKLFLCEAFVITFLAIIAACLFVLGLVPAFNNVAMIQNAGEQINIEIMRDPGVYIDLILIAIGISLLAGVYPALHLSSIRTTNALRGISGTRGFSRLRMRKILMGIQFAVSLVSIIFILYTHQIFGTWKSYDRRNVSADNCVSVYLGEVNQETFRNEISRRAMFTGVSFSEVVPFYGEWRFQEIKTEGMGEPLNAFSFNVDPEFVNLFELTVVAGRNFSREFGSDAGGAVIVNETAVRTLCLNSPEEALGKALTMGPVPGATVIGVVKDFTHRIYLENPIIPTVLVYRPDGFRYANLRYRPEMEGEIRTSLPGIWKEFDQIHPGRFSFSNDALRNYEENNTGIIKLFTWVTGLIILIALSGLTGMTAYTTERRVKEIGIRKVFGASLPRLVGLLSGSYMKLIAITCVISLPLGYMLSDLVLKFMYVAISPSLSPWIPPAAMLLIMSLAFLTTGALTLKAASADPVETLRTE